MHDGRPDVTGAAYSRPQERNEEPKNDKEMARERDLVPKMKGRGWKSTINTCGQREWDKTMNLAGACSSREAAPALPSSSCSSNLRMTACLTVSMVTCQRPWAA